MTWLWGGYAVGNPTLNRFYSLHYLLPFVIAGVVVLHIWALHVAGQNNPDRHRAEDRAGHGAFTPYATIKDAFFLLVFCVLFAWFVFYMPNYLGHADNYIPANPAVTPTHIVPEWYYLPFYAILRAIPNKLLGVIALGASILILLFLPWLDTSKVKSANYRPLYRQFFWLFVIVCVGLGWLGSKPPEGGYVIIARILTAYYFAHFLIILPLLGFFEKTKPVPNSIAESVLGKGVPLGARRRRRGRLRTRTAMAFQRKILALVLAGGVAGSLVAFAAAAEDTPQPPKQKWSFSGPFGKYDQGQLQRGFKVYREVCQVCHGLALLSFRNLAEPGGPGFTRRRPRRSPPNTRSRASPTTRASVQARPGRPPTASRRRSPTSRRRAPATTPCRPTCR